MKRFLINVGLLLPILTLSLSSCTLLFFSSTEAALEPETQGAEVSVTGITGKYFKSEGVNVYQKNDTTFDLYTFHRYHLIRQKKEGFQPKVTVIRRSRFNPGIVLDVVVPFVGGMYGGHAYSYAKGDFNDSGEFEPNPKAVNTSKAIGYAYALNGFLAPWTRYEKYYALPALTPLPSRQEGECFLSLRSFENSFKGKDHHILEFSNFKKFDKRAHKEARLSEDHLQFSREDVEVDLNELLVECGYQKEKQGLRMNNFRNLALQADLNGMKEYHISTAGAALEFKIDWKLIEMTTNNTVVEQTLETTSYAFNVHQLKDEEELKEIVTDAFRNSLIEFISLKEVKAAIKDPLPAFEAKYEQWETLRITSGRVPNASLKEALNAVVTIKTDNGQGSGCIISEKGYMVTNQHVIREAKDIVVTLASGVEVKATVVRENPVLDLALLSLDAPVDVKPLQLTDLDDIILGKNVFSVGTPEDMTLSQTVTNGIISSRRTIDGYTYIQTDASINGGNSGGALLNSEGKLLGLVNAKMIGLGIEGIGFAIPAAYLEEALKITITP